jgi:hypothetical protein
MNGWVTIDRSIFEHPLFKGSPERFYAWSWIIANACWKPTRHDIKGKIITLERGQICVGRERLAREFGWSESAVERFLTRLKTEQMIERETGQGRSILTICNYGKYQDLSGQTERETGQEIGQQSDSNRTAKEQGNHLTKEKRKKDIPQAASNFFFEGVVIRLTEIDYRRWEKAYSKLSFPSILQARDDWLATEADEAAKKKWFISTSNWLLNQQRAAPSAKPWLEQPIC